MEMAFTTQKHVRQVVATLGKTYPGRGTALEFKDPWQLLTATILSAQCTDVMVNKVTPRLFAAYPSVCALGLSLIHISEPTRLGMISYAVFCLKKKKKKKKKKKR